MRRTPAERDSVSEVAFSFLSFFFFFNFLSGDTKRRQRELKESVNIKQLPLENQRNCHDDMYEHTRASAHLKAH